MSTAYQKPELVLKKAEDLIHLDKKEIAVEVLLELLKGRRNRSWQQVYEIAAAKLLELCIYLNNVSTAKEALYQFKSLCLPGNGSSFEEVIRNFLKQSEASIERARSTGKEMLLVEDLDQVETPETIVYRAMLASQNLSVRKEKYADQLSFTSSVKFCWESYRNSLELTKNNKYLEKVYVDVGISAMKFCQKYNRKTEFRKFCDMTKSHLQIIFRGYNSNFGVDLSDQNSLQFQMTLRLSQLDMTITHELWLEAYRTMEEIYELIRISRKLPKPSMLAHFYKQTATIFFKGNSYLFHAILVQKLFLLIREQKKNVSQEELTQISNKALLASLSIPHLYDFKDFHSSFEFEEQIENINRLTSFLKLSSFPKRQSLINDMIQLSVLKHSHESLVELFQILEEPSSNLLQICHRTYQILTNLPSEMSNELSIYFDSIYDVSFCTMLMRLSRIYSRITLDRLLTLTPFYNSREVLYAKLLETGRTKIVNICIDDQGTGSVILQSSFHQGQNNAYSKKSASDLNILATMSPTLKLCRYMYDQPSQLSEINADKRRYIKILKENDLIEKRVKMIKSHHDIITECTHTITQKRTEKRKEQQMLEEHKQQQLRDQEKVLEQEEKLRLEEYKLLKEEEDKKKKMIADAESLKKNFNTTALKKILTDGSTVEEVVQDPVKLESVKKELQREEARKWLENLQSIEKKKDYYVRAVRLMEKPKLNALCENYAKEHQEYCEKTEKLWLSALKNKIQSENATRSRLEKYISNIDTFLEESQTVCSELYEKKLTEFEILVEKEKAMAEASAIVSSVK